MRCESVKSSTTSPLTVYFAHLLYDILGNGQSGFRKGHSTMDHVFALHCLIDVYLQRKKRSYFVRLLTIKRPLTVCSADFCGENC